MKLAEVKIIPQNGSGDFNDHDDRRTIAGVRITLPDGTYATAFLVVTHDGSGFSAAVTHDATDYASGTVGKFKWLSKYIRLKFYAPDGASPAPLRKQEAGSP